MRVSKDSEYDPKEARILRQGRGEQEVCPYSRVLGSYPLDVTGSRTAQEMGSSGLPSAAQEPNEDTLEEQLEAGIPGIAGARSSLAEGPSLPQLLSGSFAAETASSSEVRPTPHRHREEPAVPVSSGACLPPPLS